MRHHEMCNSIQQRPASRFGRALASLSLASLLSLTAVVTARADDQVRAVRLSNVVGGVQIMNGTETEFSQAYPNMPLMQGSTLKTGEDGRAEIQFEDGSTVRLTPNSSATMGQLSRTSEGNTNTEVDLLTGLSYVEMKGTENQRFVVHFDGNEVISPAPVEFRVNLDANPNEFAVLDGSAHVSKGSFYAMDVRANETVRFDATDEGRYFLAQGIDGDSWDQWNTDRDQAMSQLAAQETREARGNANPADPAWADLDYYGNWYSSGGQSFWAPYGAGAGWDPYGSGYWGYYGGIGGYAWISGYPWGWLPYHCGTWNYFNSFGWGWAPGGCGGGWYPNSTIGYAPARYHRLPAPLPARSPIVVGVRPPNGFRPGRTLIPVDRGLEATTLAPRVGPVPRTVTLNNGEPAHLLPKNTNPVSTVFVRPGIGTTARTESTYVPGRQPGQGAVPVNRPATPVYAYRPTAPPSAYRGGGSEPSNRPAAPSFSSHVNSGASAAPRMSAPSAPSGGGSASHAASSGGGSSGGGHTK